MLLANECKVRRECRYNLIGLCHLTRTARKTLSVNQINLKTHSIYDQTANNLHYCWFTIYYDPVHIVPDSLVTTSSFAAQEAGATFNNKGLLFR